MNALALDCSRIHGPAQIISHADSTYHNLLHVTAKTRISSGFYLTNIYYTSFFGSSNTASISREISVISSATSITGRCS